jgi:hypothetical protein
MTKITKHTDLLVLAVLVAAVLGGVLLFDRVRLGADERSTAEDPESQTSLYAGRTAQVEGPEPDTRAPQTVLAWAQTEEGNLRDDRRPVPAPYQQGVVQLGVGASLGGKLPFPEESLWNQPIDHLDVDPLSDVLINSIGCEKHVHPDFGSGTWNGAQIGIPYVVVSGKQLKVPIKFTAYGNESDPGPYPIPFGAPIEGDPNVEGDRHLIVIDRDNWKLYELFRAFPIGGGQLWRAESGAIFDLGTNHMRPAGWTSADAAGLPVFAGLVRYEEAAEQKEIRHALRFTVSKSRQAYVPPARHWASRHTDLSLPPMGMRVRLKKDFDVTGYPPEVQTILVALKKYGMILADNGSDWFISGAPDPRWNDDNLRALKKLQGCDFEVVTMEGLVEEQACNCPDGKKTQIVERPTENASELLPTISRESLLK